MASLRDLLFGAGVLKKAAEGPPAADQNSAPPANPSGIDLAAEANKAAARSLPAKPVTPATPAPTVAPKKKKPTAADAIGTALKL